jgi:hypothetical protein
MQFTNGGVRGRSRPRAFPGDNDPAAELPGISSSESSASWCSGASDASSESSNSAMLAIRSASSRVTVTIACLVPIDGALRRVGNHYPRSFELHITG